MVVILKCLSPSRSGASGAGLQGAGGEKHVPAGSSHQQRHERLAGAHAGANLAAPLRAAAALRGPLHPASAAPPGHPVQGLRPHGEGGDRQREYQDGFKQGVLENRAGMGGVLPCRPQRQVGPTPSLLNRSILYIYSLQIWLDKWHSLNKSF